MSFEILPGHPTLTVEPIESYNRGKVENRPHRVLLNGKAVPGGDYFHTRAMASIWSQGFASGYSHAAIRGITL